MRSNVVRRYMIFRRNGSHGLFPTVMEHQRGNSSGLRAPRNVQDDSLGFAHAR